MVFFGVNVAIIWSPQCRCRRESFYICISLLLISVPPPVARSYNFEPRSHRCLSLPIFVSCASNSAQLLDCLNIDCAESCIRIVLVTNHPRADQSTCCMTLGSDEGWSLERRSAGPSQRRVRSVRHHHPRITCQTIFASTQIVWAFNTLPSAISLPFYPHLPHKSLTPGDLGLRRPRRQPSLE